VTIPRRLSLAVSVSLFVLGLPAAASAQLATTCDASLWNHVYHPARLVRLHECMRVTGTIVLKRPEPDGDVHIQLKLDKKFLPLLNATNKSRQGGNLVLEPGDASVETLIGRVERGLYVTRFHYVNGYLDPRNATMTGMTRDGTFLIKDGRLGPAVPNLRWTESLLEAFNRVGGVGSELQSVPSRWTSSISSILCPALLIRGFRFAGKSSA